MTEFLGLAFLALLGLVGLAVLGDVVALLICAVLWPARALLGWLYASIMARVLLTGGRWPRGPGRR